jgi:isoleucyl-tRNA synthetase
VVEDQHPRRFPAVPPEPDFRALEEQALEHWEAHDVFSRSISERRSNAEYVFFEGPPTANGRPGLHHVWARVYKDLICRYRTMTGRRVPRRAGWDTHGLAVEVEVEKALGLSGKDQIEEYGVERFVDRCRQSVYEYVDDWKALTRRTGYWVDLENAYWTLDPAYIDSVWWHLSQLWESGDLFEDLKVVPYCPRCGTSLSSHELGQPDVYQDIEDLSAYVRLPVVGDRLEGADALVIWTTTPWTLVANTAVAVQPDLNYVVVDGLVMAEDRVEAVLGPAGRDRVTARFPGERLVGLHYRRPIDLLPEPDGSDGWRVVPAGFVSAAEGSGLVHIAPAFGLDDWLLGRRDGLPALNPVGPDGRFVDAGWLSGLSVREANQPILEYLADAGLLVKAEAHVHSYPHCWRCGTALIYWGKPSWYVATSRHKDQLLAENEGVTWRPGTLKHGRFGEWLANNIDWALSRDRYWGTPLPIWRCPNGHDTCVASRARLSELAARDLTDIDPHRPVIDEVTFDCPQCRQTARRVEAVIDAWFDSGSMPAAQLGYPYRAGSKKDLRLPADFICEAVDQTRGWFYSLLAVNTLVFGRAPYRTVMSLGHIVDSEGKKMSKSLGNVIDPWAILDTRGAEPMRWWMFHQGSPWTATRTSLEAIDASTSEVLMTLWNTWSFFATYAELNHFDPTDPAVPAPQDRPAFDRWLRSRLEVTVAEVTAALDDYQPLPAAKAIGALVDDLSNWYVRANRRRFWRTDPSVDDAGSLSAQAALHEALVKISLLMAPFCPFLAEKMWRELTGADDAGSVHLASWPEADASHTDPELEAAMDLARRLVSLGRSARAQSGIRVRQPLRRALVALPPDSPRLLEDVVAEELNVDEVVTAHGIGELVSFELVPNFRLLGPRLGDAVKEVRPALARADAAVVVDELERHGLVRLELSSGAVELGPGEIEVRVTARTGFAVSREGAAAVALDLDLDDGLRKRGLLRDVTRQVQSLRRDAGLQLSDRIVLSLAGLDELREEADFIGREVLAASVGFFPADAAPKDAMPVETDDGRDARAWLKPVPG